MSLTLTRAQDNTAGIAGSEGTGAFRDADDMSFDSPLTDTAPHETSDLELVIVFSEADAAFGNHLITGESLNDWEECSQGWRDLE